MDDLLEKLQLLLVAERRKVLGHGQVPLQLIHGLHADDGRADRQPQGVPQRPLVVRPELRQRHDLHADHSYPLRICDRQELLGKAQNEMIQRGERHQHAVEGETASGPPPAPADSGVRRQPAKTPSGPSSTAARAGGSATMVTTTSAPAAASRGVATTVAPSGFRASAFAAVRFCARTAYPALRTFLTIRPPMMPNPTKATVCPMMLRSFYCACLL